MEGKGGVEEVVIAAVCENKAREVGLAVFEVGTAVLYLQQYVENSFSFSISMTQLAHHNPSKLIVLDSENRRKVLSSSINEATSQVYDQVPLPRSCFDDTSAIHFLSKVATGDEGALKSESYKKYYMALASASALINYLRTQYQMEPHDIKMHFTGPSTHLMIDYSTLVSLELLQACQYTNQRNAHLKYTSVLSAINHTCTTGGKKMLKMSLVQPLRDIDTIRARQKAVQELLENPDLLKSLSGIMAKVPKDHEAVCLQFATNFPSLRADKSKWISQTVGKLLRLKSLLELLPSLAQELEKASSLLLQAVCVAASRADVSKILGILKEMLVDEELTEEQVAGNVTHQIYMIRCQENSVLDIARKDFAQVSQQVHDLAENYRSTFGLKKLKLHFSARKKFHFGVSKKFVESELSEGMPETFIPLQASQANLFYTTLELNVLNSRLQTSLSDCFEILASTIEALTEQVKGKISHLRVLVEAISTLDLILSFAVLTGRSPDGYSCPDLEPSGPLLIVEGHHILLQSKGEAQSNSTFLSENRSLEVISGPNMAGKSSYSRQVALIVILGHMGSFVPAKYARIPVFSSILTRCTVRNDSGSIEDNLSSFYMEMQDIARITKSLTPSSLVIVDEIGRSTSDADGEAIAWSVAEHLLSAKAFSVFITHYEIFHQMPSCYPRCLHRAFPVCAAQADCHRLQDSRAASGRNSEAAGQYGIDLAQSIGYPEEIIQGARLLSKLVLQNKSQASSQQASSADQSLRLKMQAYDQLEVLSLLSSKSRLSEADLRSELSRIQDDLKKLMTTCG